MIKLVDVELSVPLTPLEDLDGTERVQLLVRLHGAPVGYAVVQPRAGACAVQALWDAIIDQCGDTIIRRLVGAALAAPDSGALALGDLTRVPPPAPCGWTPAVTVAVCTRDRTEGLARCLDALSQLVYPGLDLLVVDNAPTSDATERLVRTRYPLVRYVREPTPGLDWARNRAIAECRGEILAFTDDDVVVDPQWVNALARPFAEDPAVMAVTGLVAPFELETEAQELFERYGGFGRGFERLWFHCPPTSRRRAATVYGGTGMCGTGANMAFRSSVFDAIGTFDPALDVGTATNGGGDLEMFFRVLEAGHVLVYEPAALVRHRHRREYAELRTQLRNNGIGLYAYFACAMRRYPRQRWAFLRLGVWWFWWWNLRRLLLSLINPSAFPRDLILAELRGCFAGLLRYRRASRIAVELGAAPTAARTGQRRKRRRESIPIAVRQVDAGRPLPVVDDIAGYDRTQLFVTHGTQAIGGVRISSNGLALSAARLRDEISRGLAPQLVALERERGVDGSRVAACTALVQGWAPPDHPGRPARALDPDVPVSIVLATRDRPDDLRACLRSALAQATARPVEIIVVDNNPASGLTPPVIAEFSTVLLVSEPMQGLSRARNTGILACHGEIVVTIDDDVVVPPHWLEALLAPFASTGVGIVTGNVLPFELETWAQHLFEAYGGLGRGFEPLDVGREWFRGFNRHAVPTWTLGATANAAFRRSLFAQPEIGLLDEALGAGTPTGCSEDTYLYYRALRAGARLAYAPAAFVWHKHRRTMRALVRQIFNYSKGHVAYQLTTLIHDGDPRALRRLLIELPLTHLWRIQARLRSRSPYTLSLVLVELCGQLAGPWALWRSRRQVKRLGPRPRVAPLTGRPAEVVPEQSLARAELDGVVSAAEFEAKQQARQAEARAMASAISAAGVARPA